MPHDFAVRLYGLTRVGVPVVIADVELKPVEFADPHLFVHKDKPPVIVAAAPASDDATKILPPVDQSAPATTDQLGLRVDPRDGPPAAATPAVATQDATAPLPPAKPADVTPSPPAKNTPISIFISRREKKIFVRQDFAPLFEAPITIEHPDQPLGTHVFTALEFLADRATLRWNVVSLPGEPAAKPARGADNGRQSEKRAAQRRDQDADKIVHDLPPPQTAAEALARIAIPQDVADRISQLMMPGSSLIVSDQGLGDETGDGTDFIVVTQ
jgi:hypothetical protein